MSTSCIAGAADVADLADLGGVLRRDQGDLGPQRRPRARVAAVRPRPRRLRPRRGRRRARARGARAARRRRGAYVYCEIAGYATRGNAYHMTGLRPTASRCPRRSTTAMGQGRLDPHDIDYVNAHGSGTKQNDRHETAAVKRSLGRPRLRDADVARSSRWSGTRSARSARSRSRPACSPSSTDVVPPTANLRRPRSRRATSTTCPITAREARVSHVVSVGSGFGGFQSAVVLSYQPEGRVTGAVRRPCGDQRAGADRRRSAPARARSGDAPARRRDRASRRSAASTPATSRCKLAGEVRDVWPDGVDRSPPARRHRPVDAARHRRRGPRARRRGPRSPADDARVRRHGRHRRRFGRQRVRPARDRGAVEPGPEVGQPCTSRSPGSTPPPPGSCRSGTARKGPCGVLAGGAAAGLDIFAQVSRGLGRVARLGIVGATEAGISPYAMICQLNGGRLSTSDDANRAYQPFGERTPRVTSSARAARCSSSSGRAVAATRRTGPRRVHQPRRHPRRTPPAQRGRRRAAAVASPMRSSCALSPRFARPERHRRRLRRRRRQRRSRRRRVARLAFRARARTPRRWRSPSPRPPPGAWRPARPASTSPRRCRPSTTRSCPRPSTSERCAATATSTSSAPPVRVDPPRARPRPQPRRGQRRRRAQRCRLRPPIPPSIIQENPMTRTPPLDAFVDALHAVGVTDALLGSDLTDPELSFAVPRPRLAGDHRDRRSARGAVRAGRRRRRGRRAARPRRSPPSSRHERRGGGLTWPPPLATKSSSTLRSTRSGRSPTTWPAGRSCSREYAEANIVERHGDTVRFELVMHPEENGTVWRWVSERTTNASRPHRARPPRRDGPVRVHGHRLVLRGGLGRRRR